VLAHPLDDEPGVPVDEDAHRAPPAARTTAEAASVMVSAVSKLRPDSFSIARPRSSLLPFHPHHHRHHHPEVAHRGDDAFGEDVAAEDAAEDVDEHRLHVAVGEQDAEGVLDLVGARAPATSRKLAGAPPASLMMSMVAMARPAPLTMQPTVSPLELDVVQAVLGGLDLEGLLLVEVAQLDELGMAKERVVVEVDLRVEGEDVARLRDQEGVDLDERRVGALEGAVEGEHEGLGLFTTSGGRPRPKASLRAW